MSHTLSSLACTSTCARILKRAEASARASTQRDTLHTKTHTHARTHTRAHTDTHYRVFTGGARPNSDTVANPTTVVCRGSPLRCVCSDVGLVWYQMWQSSAVTSRETRGSICTICVGSIKDKASHTSAEDSWRHHEFADPTFTSLMLSCFQVQIALNRLCAPLSRISSSERNLSMHSSHGPAPDPAKAKDHGKPTGSITTLIANAAPCTTISPAAAAASIATSMPVPVPSPPI